MTRVSEKPKFVKEQVKTRSLRKIHPELKERAFGRGGCVKGSGPRSSVIGHFRLARNPTRIDGKCGGHVSQADLSVPIVVHETIASDCTVKRRSTQQCGCRLVSKQAAVASVVKLAQVSGFRDQETEIGNSKIHT